jgi:uncharacterized protein YdhG (YjbR/CyaY superfamily)
VALEAETSPATIDEYIAQFPREVQSKLQKIRRAIRKEIPQAEEAIKYRIPTFVFNGNLIHFAAFRSHIGVYPAPRSDPKLAKELARYGGGKGTLQLPLDQPIPLDLIRRIVHTRVREQRRLVAEREKKAAAQSRPKKQASVEKKPAANKPPARKRVARSEKRR